MACAPAAVAKLWDVCQVPDYRKISGQSHSELVGTIYKFLMGQDERIPEDWFSKQVAFADRTDGDIDTLANRIAHIRTWTFVSNRADWLKDPAHWQGRTREIEDKLSDALHECLTQRFVDLRTSALMKGMRDKDELHAEIAEDGAVRVESHYVGRLRGFRFSPDAGGEGIHGKAARNAAAQVLARELSMRARRVAAAQPDALQATRRGRILWKDEEIGQLEATDDPLKPSVTLLCDEHLSGPDREKVLARLEAWVAQTIADKLKPLVDIGKAEDISGLARGIAFRLREGLGVLKRETVAGEIKALDQSARAQLRKYGVRFGAFNIYFPLLLKPAAAELILTLWSLKHAGASGLSLDALPEPPRAGLTSFAPDPACPEAFYRAYGYHVCGPRAVRLDMLERLADHIRPLLSWRPSAEGAAPPPKGATGDGGFTVTPEMMSLLGCSPEELSGVLKALGFRVDRRPVKSVQAPPAAPSQEEAPADQPEAAPEAAPAAAVATGEPQTVAIASADAALEAKEPEFEEIWRPRRHARGEHRKDAGARPRRRPGREDAAGQSTSPAPAAAAEPAQTQGGNGHDVRPVAGREAQAEARGERSKEAADRGRDSHARRPKGPERRRREERRKPEVHSAAPPRRVGIEADSPFAALGALRDALAKRAKESGS
jgi:ATP-dependent RNA helicase SUPV3L1/SUV3